MEIRGDKIEKSYYHRVNSKYPLCPYTLPEIYEYGAKNYPDKGMIWHRPEEKLTYKQAYEKTLLFAKGLLGLGVTRGDTVSCFGSQGSDSAVMFFACSTIGAIFQARYLYSPVSKLIKDSIDRIRPKVILFGNALSGIRLENTFDVVKQILAERSSKNEKIHAFYDDLAAADPNCMTHDKNDTLCSSLDVLLKAGEKVTDEALNQAKSILSLNEPCIYATTSGSTGEPKHLLFGAAIHSNSGIRQQERFKAEENMVFGAPNMCTEEIATIEQLLAGFFVGMDTVILPQLITWDIKTNCCEILDICQKYKPYMVYGDNYFLKCIINNPEYRKDYDISATKSFLITGSCSTVPFKKAMLDVLPDSVDCYGLSEFFYATCAYPGQHKLKPGTIGKPYVNVEIMIADESGLCVPRMTRGEILVRGYLMFICYKDEPEKTKLARTDEGWCKTGDCGYMDSDGDIYIVGRMSDRERFKVDGDVVYAAPIESTLKGFSKIKECAVVGRPDEDGIGHEIIYCIVPYERDNLTVEEIQQFAMRNCTQREWPCRIFFYSRLPHSTLRAKVSKKDLLKDIENKVTEDDNAGWIDYPEWEQ